MHELLKKICFWILAILPFLIIFLPPDSWINIKFFFVFFCLYFPTGYLFLSLIKFDLSKRSLTEIIIYSLISGASLWLISIYILGVLGAGSERWAIYLVAIIVTLFFLFKESKEKILFDKFVKASKSWDSILILLVFNILLLVAFIPIKGLLVAPLHDPAHNSTVASKLISGKFLYDSIPVFGFHYPPGGAYITALIGSIAGIGGAKSSLITTVTFSIIASFSFKVLIEKLSKSRKLANVSFIFLSLAFPYILGLYTMAGKNSQVIAYSFLFVSLALFYESINKNIFWKLLTVIVLSASFLIHYTNIFVFAVLIIPIYLFEIILQKKDKRVFLKDILGWILPLVLILIIGILQFVMAGKSPNGGNLTGSQANAIGPGSLWNFILFLFQPPANVFERLNDIFLFAGPFVYFFLLIRSVIRFVKSKVLDKFELFILFIPVSFLALYSFTKFKVSYFSNLHIFFFIVILFSYLIYLFLNLDLKGKLRKAWNFLRVGFIILSIPYLIFSVYWIYRGNTNARELTVVQENDIKAFQWIEENTKEDEYFLPSALSGFEIEQNYETDGLLYLKAFTDREDALSFVHGDDLTGEADLRDEYLKLSENIGDEEILDVFTERKIIYIYVDSAHPAGKSYMNSDKLADYPLLYDLVYNSDGIKIYKIIR